MENQPQIEEYLPSGGMDVDTAITKFLSHNHDGINSRKTVDAPRITELDAQNVKLTGDQTVAGVKTFSSFPITPSSAPTTDYQTANKKYVDDEISGIANVVYASASGETKISDDSQLNPGSSKTIQIMIPGSIRVAFSQKRVTGDDASCTINIRHCNVDYVILTQTTNDTSYQNYSVDFNVCAGDVIKISQSSGYSYNFRLQYDINIISSIYAIDN